MTKVCTGCSRTLELGDFAPNPSGKHGRHSRCRDCQRKGLAVHRQRPGVRERHREDCARWYAKNREQQDLKALAWHAANPEARRVFAAASRARRRGVASTLTLDEWTGILARYDGRCAYCGADFETIDHVVPLSRGGPNDRTNVVPACLSCNCSKQDSIWRAAEGAAVAL